MMINNNFYKYIFLRYCYIELPELVIRSCLICRKSDENNKPVMGFSLCSDCRNAFDELFSNFHDNPICLEEPECRCATYECRKCLKEKFVQFGIFQTYVNYIFEHTYGKVIFFK